MLATVEVFLIFFPATCKVFVAVRRTCSTYTLQHDFIFGVYSFEFLLAGSSMKAGNWNSCASCGMGITPLY